MNFCDDEDLAIVFKNISKKLVPIYTRKPKFPKFSPIFSREKYILSQKTTG
jgi:hypothetical protein